MESQSRKLWKGSSWIFYLRLSNPAFKALTNLQFVFVSYIKQGACGWLDFVKLQTPIVYTVYGKKSFLSKESDTKILQSIYLYESSALIVKSH